MRTNLDCVPCVMQQALRASRVATDDKDLQREALKEVALSLSEASFENTPLALSHKAQRIVREVTGISDPYKELKEECNREVMEMYSELKSIVSESEDRILTATKLSIAGNIIDFGPGHDFEVENVVEEVLDMDFSVDHFEEFKEELKESERVFYLADNAGEIVFDRVFLELEELEDKEVTFFVKGYPVLNDAMAEDAKFVGIDNIVEVEEVGGEGSEGLDLVPQNFVNRLENADLVISKGQGNYEAFSELKSKGINIFFLFMVKCPLVAKDVGAKEGSIILK